MSEKTNEELAEWLDKYADQKAERFSDRIPEIQEEHDLYREAAARLRQQSEDSARLDTEVTCPHCNGLGVVDAVLRCVVDGEDNAVDYCVLDHDRPQDCAYAPDVLKAGGKQHCREWRRVAIDKARKA